MQNCAMFSSVHNYYKIIHPTHLLSHTPDARNQWCVTDQIELNLCKLCPLELCPLEKFA